MPIHSPHLDKQIWMRVSRNFANNFHLEWEAGDGELRALSCNGSQNQPTRCYSSVRRKQHHQAPRQEGPVTIKQRKPSVNSDEPGLDLPVISNPILETRNCNQPPYLRTWMHLLCYVKDVPLKSMAFLIRLTYSSPLKIRAQRKYQFAAYKLLLSRS